MAARHRALALVLLVSLLTVGCGPAAPTAAPVSPTASPVPATPVPPTATPMPPMATAVPPTPTDTSLPPPTATPLPPPAVPSVTSTPAPLLLLENSPQLFGSTETFQVGLGDLDGDGDLDAVLANMAANDSQVWFNDGAGQFIDSGQRLTQQGHGVALGDLDSDGDLDIFITCAHFGSGGSWSKKPSRVYLNDGRGTFQDSGQDIGDTELSGNGVNLIDLDGDGDLDTHVIYYEVGGMVDKVYLNDGAGRFSDSGLTLQEEEIAWGDLDADGDADILAKGYGEGYRVLLNDGAGQFVTGWQVEDSQAMYGDLALADLDGDGDLDALVASGFRSEGSFPTRLLWNDGTGQFTDSGQELNETMAARFAVGDLDRDGDLDLFVSNGDHWSGEVWLNDGAGRFVDSGLRLQSPSRHLATWPSLGDLDGDSDLDVVEAGFQGKAEVWLNKTPFSAVPPRNASLGDTWTRPADRMVMVYVPGGEFQIGSDDDEVDAALEMCQAYYTIPCERAWFENEQPVHPVVLHGFWLDPTEVTNAQYRRCMEAGACSSPERSDSDTRQAYYGDSAYDDYPVVHVTWGQADAYCRWAGGRLPTEAEWEWAARGPEGRRYPWGQEYDGTRLNSCDVNCGYEWAEDAFDDGYGDTAPVGSYPDGASWCGALDLAGNVWEWTADWYGEYPTERQSNPAGPSSGTSRALRGDAADGTRAVSRAAARHGMTPGRVYEYTGFRCVVPAQPTDTPPPESTATPTSPLDNSGGVIAFYSDRDGNPEIYIMNPDGSDQRRLTFSQFEDSSPDWSPDGSQIAFISDRDDPQAGNCFPDCVYQIYVIHADGSGEHKLVDTEFRTLHPDWHPDGTKLSFDTEFNLEGDVYVVNADGSGLQRLIHDGFWADWSPDGMQLVFASKRDGNVEIYVADADGGNQRRLTDNSQLDYFPAWSPDGRRIASARLEKKQIYVMNADGSDEQQLTHQSNAENPSWSPDGAHIVFQSSNEGNFEIYTIHVENALHGSGGSAPRRLTENHAADLWPSWGPVPGSGLYLGQTPPGLDVEVFAPGIVSIEKGKEYNITISPDLQGVFFTRRTPGGRDDRIWTSRLENGKLTMPELAPFTYDLLETDACFTPDGNRLYFNSARPLPGGNTASPLPNVWFVDRTETGWSEPQFVGPPLNDYHPVYFSIANDGTLYFTRSSPRGIYYAEPEEGQYLEAHRLPDEINYVRDVAHSAVAPDESYIIVNSSYEQDGRLVGSLYISFKRPDGSWTKAVSMHDALKASEADVYAIPRITPDGKYLFFERYEAETDRSDIYWVSTAVVEQLRPH